MSSKLKAITLMIGDCCTEGGGGQKERPSYFDSDHEGDGNGLHSSKLWQRPDSTCSQPPTAQITSVLFLAGKKGTFPREICSDPDE